MSGWNYVQGWAQKVATTVGGNVTTAAAPSQPTVGNRILVAVECHPSSPGKLSYSDSAGGNSPTYLGGSEAGVGSVNATTTNISSDTICFFVVPITNTAASFAITIGLTSSTGGEIFIQAWELSGGSNSPDGSGSTNDGTNATTMTTGAVTTTNPDSLLLIGAAITYNGSSNPTISSEPIANSLPTSTFSNHLNELTGNALAASAFDALSATLSGTNYTWTGTNFGGGWATIAIALQPAAGAPGVPTGLSASYVSSTEVALSWTQGSGTVTDNEVQYSTDGQTWTTIDIGSAATSYTVTGLSPNTVYVFQVNAGDSGSYSAYSEPCLGATAPFVTFEPTSDQSTSGWSKTGSTFYGSLNTGADTSYISSSGAQSINLGTGLTPPANFVAATACSIFARAQASTGASVGIATSALLASAASSLCQQTSSSPNLTTSFANYVLAQTLTSGQGQGWGAWYDALMQLQINSGAITIEVSQLMGIVLYSTTPALPPLDPLYFHASGYTRASRARRVEGVRFVYNCLGSCLRVLRDLLFKPLRLLSAVPCSLFPVPFRRAPR